MPFSELVVTPLGYDLTPTTPAALAARMLSGVSALLRYSVMKNSTSGAAALRSARYATACATVVIAGVRLGCHVPAPPTLRPGRAGAGRACVSETDVCAAPRPLPARTMT